jgi:hyperosmotically inducible periplasmic protein
MKRLWIVVLLSGLYGCASAISSGYGQGGQNSDGRSYTEARLDNQISAAVSDLLVMDRSVSAMNIDVSTVNGVVTLNGVVENTAMATRASQLAGRVEGVAQVVNNLRILRP